MFLQIYALTAKLRFGREGREKKKIRVVHTKCYQLPTQKLAKSMMVLLMSTGKYVVLMQTTILSADVPSRAVTPTK